MQELKQSPLWRRVNYEHESWCHSETFSNDLCDCRLALGVIMIFSYDVIKIDWPSFMEIQPSYRQMENPLPVPEHSIPIEGSVYIPTARSCRKIQQRRMMPPLRAAGTLHNQLPNVPWDNRGRKWTDCGVPDEIQACELNISVDQSFS